MAKLVKKETKTLMDRVHKMAALEEETGLISLYSEIEKDELNVDLGKVVVNKAKETVVLITPDNEKIIAKPTKTGGKDKFDAMTGVGIVILKALTGLTNSRYETKNYEELTGLTYEELALDLLNHLGLTKEVFDREYAKDDDSYTFDIAIIGKDPVGEERCAYCGEPLEDDYDEDYCDYCEDCDYCEEDMVDPIEEKCDETKELVDDIAKALGVDPDSYTVSKGEMKGMPGIYVYGTDEKLAEALKRMIHPFIV